MLAVPLHAQLGQGLPRGSAARPGRERVAAAVIVGRRRWWTRDVYAASAICAMWNKSGVFGLNMQKSGLVDTMLDLIVDAVGALVMALLGFAHLSKARIVSFLERGFTRFIQANPRFFKDPA